MSLVVAAIGGLFAVLGPAACLVVVQGLIKEVGR